MCEGERMLTLVLLKDKCLSDWGHVCILRDLSDVGDILNLVFYLVYNLKIGVNTLKEMHCIWFLCFYRGL